MNRVVITGLGPVTPIGIGIEEFVEALKQGKSGVSEITKFDTSRQRAHHAAEIKGFSLEEFCPDIPIQDARRLDLFSQYALVGAELATEDSGIIPSIHSDPGNVAIRLGVGIGGIGTIEEEKETIMKNGPRRVSPLLVPKVIPDAASTAISMRYGIKGETATVNSACSSALTAICDAYDKIRLGNYPIIISGGAEASLTELPFTGFANSRSLSTLGISRPYDKERDGFVISEGAGIIILEELNHALRRGAKIYGEIIGYGATSDAHHVTAPDPDGAGLLSAIDRALDSAKVSTVDYINSHGTSTQFNDRTETAAIKRAFGPVTAKTIPISSVKSMTGHSLGASGGIELIATLIAMEKGFIPPTINYKNPDPECDLDYVPNEARAKKIDTALKLSLGFGGHNHALVVRRYDGN